MITYADPTAVTSTTTAGESPAGSGAGILVVGVGEERYERALRRAERRHPGRVAYVADDGEPAARRAYAGADLFCMPGIAELQSLVTLEAMAAGLPVIAADAMALPHLVRPGRNGWLYTPGDVPELTTRLAALLGDAATRRRMGAASREIVAAHGSEATLDRFEGIYAQVLGRVPVEARRAA